MMSETVQERISAKEEMKVMKTTNEDMEKYITQMGRQLQELGTKAQKALLFPETFGVVSEVLQPPYS